MTKPTLGFIGLGGMGLPMAKNLLRAGYTVIGFDPRCEPRQDLAATGGQVGPGTEEIARQVDILHLCLVGPMAKAVFSDQVADNLQAEQIVLDHSTIPVPDTRRQAGLAEAKGAIYLDAPISGGTGGAQRGELRIFVGGNQAAFGRVRPILAVLGREDKLIYAGPSGQGQAVKVIQQLTHRLLRAARMEVAAFGVSEGLSWDLIYRALDVEPNSDDPYDQLIRQVTDNQIPEASVLFGEWEYFLKEADEKGIPMPMLRGLWEFCKDAEKPVIDGQGGPGPDLWAELTRDRQKPGT